MTDAARHDVWAIGEGYERYVGRWSRLVAPKFIEWLALPGQLKWLDIGCGTGALTRAILQEASPTSVVGVEPSAQIELPVPAPLFDREPGLEAHRRALHELLEALQEWEKSRGEITWPGPDGRK